MLGLLLLYGLKSTSAFSQVQISLEAVSQEPLPLLMAPFTVKEGEAAVGEKFTAEINTYLQLSEHFRLIDPKALLKDVSQEGFLPIEIDFNQYKILSATILVKGWGKVRNGRVLGELFAYDVGTQKPILHNPLAINQTELARAAQDFVDQLLLKLTGERGIFDTRIAFISNRSGKKELWVMNFDGSNLQQVTNYENLVLSPTWSADGEQLLFVGYPKNPRKETPQLFYATPGDDRFRAFRRLPSNVIAPYWVRGTDQIIATLSHEGDSELYWIHSNSGDLKRLTISNGIDVSASVSPDGKMMVWSSDRTGNPQIYVQSLSSAGEVADRPRRISYEGKYNTSPDWSPHGSNIAYSGLTDDNKINIFVTRPDGLMTTQMTANIKNNEHPSWSPDGRRLVFSSNRDGIYHIYTMTVDGKNLRQLTQGKYNDTMPTWSPRRRSRIN
jgi:TolB protein